MTAFILKIIASACMLIDHVGAVFPASTPYFFRVIGRIAFPIYAYMIAQGCRYTKNINKYLLRLGLFALISEIPFDLAFHPYTWDGVTNILDINFLRHSNVFYTLFLGVACVAVYEKLKHKKMTWLALLPIPLIPAIILLNFLPEGFPISTGTLAAIIMALSTAGILCLANLLPDVENEENIPFKRKIIPLLAVLPLLATAEFFKTDYGAIGVCLIFLLYLAKPENKLTRSVVLTAGIAYLYGQNLISTSGDFINGQFIVMSRTLNPYALAFLAAAFIAVILLLFYNGRQGPKVKWAFYAFYPAHIAVLAAIWFVFVG